MEVTCNLCKQEYVRLDECIAHIKEDHTGVFSPDDFWPDGELAIIDTTLEPKDFLD